MSEAAMKAEHDAVNGATNEVIGAAGVEREEILHSMHCTMPEVSK